MDDNFETNVPGIFAAGNVVHVYDLVDWVSEAGKEAGNSAAKFACASAGAKTGSAPAQPGKTCATWCRRPSTARTLAEASVRLQLRVKQPIESPVWVEVRNKDNLVTRKGELYARPGEIITLEIPVKAYDEVQLAEELTVAVVKR